MNHIKLTQLTASLLYKNNLVIMDNQTPQVDQQIILYSKEVDTKEFGKLIELPALYGKNKSRVENAKVYTNLQLAAVRVVDIATVDPIFMEGVLKPIRELRILLSDAKKEVAEDRKPTTQKMDAIKSLFVAIENDFDALDEEPKDWLNKWEMEKLRRERLKKSEDAKKLAKQTESVELLKNCRLAISNNFTVMLQRELNALINAFTLKTPTELPEFVKSLGEWEPVFDDDLLNEVKTVKPTYATYHTPDEYDAIEQQALSEVVNGFNADYTEKIKNEIEKLTALAPSRILELQSGDASGAADKISNLKTETATELSNEFAHNATVIETAAENNKPVVAVFASTTFKKGKGSTIKKKYKIESHKALAAIIKFYVANTLHLLTLPDAEKIFSKAITEANRQLNLGTVIEEEGLTQIDDAIIKRV